MLLYFLLEIGLGLALLVIVVCRANEMSRRAKITYKLSYIGIAFGGVFLLKAGVNKVPVDWPLLVSMSAVGLLLLTTRMRWASGMPEDALSSGRLLDDLRELVGKS